MNTLYSSLKLAHIFTYIIAKLNMLKGLIKISLLCLVFIVVTVIPSNSSLVFGYGSNSGDAPTFAGSTTEPPVCNKEKPSQVILYEPNHYLLPKATKPGEVRLNWLKVDKATTYTIAFGLASHNYIYGLPDTGNTDNFTVGNLSIGKTYYFVVRGVNDCMPGPWSREWSVKVGRGSSTSLLTKVYANSTKIITPVNISATISTEVVATPTPAITIIETPPPAQPEAETTYAPRQIIPTPEPLPPPTPEPDFFQKIIKSIRSIFGI
jgi:hypothetical protein